MTLSLKANMQLTVKSVSKSNLTYTLQSGSNYVDIVEHGGQRDERQAVTIPLSELKELVDIAEKQGFLKPKVPEGPVPR